MYVYLLSFLASIVGVGGCAEKTRAGGTGVDDWWDWGVLWGVFVGHKGGNGEVIEEQRIFEAPSDDEPPMPSIATYLTLPKLITN